MGIINFQGKRDKDSIHKDALNLYRQSKSEWNIKIYSYQSLLKHYYNDEIKNEFVSNIYNPMVELGKEAEYTQPDKSFIDKLNNHTQFELDSYRLPHPILGKITLGELAIFTSFHTSHHFELLKSKLLGKLNNKL